MTYSTITSFTGCSYIDIGLRVMLDDCLWWGAITRAPAFWIAYDQHGILVGHREEFVIAPYNQVLGYAPAK